MAYANYLASVEWAEVTSLRKGLRSTVVPHSITVVSHLYASAVRAPSVAQLLTRILDQGEVLSEAYWHPLRVPVVHSPEAVHALASQLRSALEKVNLSEVPGGKPDPSVEDIVRVLNEAAKSSHAIISVLEPPTDEERRNGSFAHSTKPPNCQFLGNMTERFRQLKRR